MGLMSDRCDFISKVMDCVSDALPGHVVMLLPSSIDKQAEFSADYFHGVLQFREDAVLFVVEQRETKELLAWGQTKSLQDALNAISLIIRKRKLNQLKQAG